MANQKPKIRLYVSAPLEKGAEVILDKSQSHYLVNVMRQKTGDCILLFNGSDGEWSAYINSATKKAVVLNCEELLKVQTSPPDVWLLFAPIKKARTDFIVEKATEMGCQRIIPVITDHTNSERVRQDRLQAHAVEAAEQCGLMTVPDVTDTQALRKLIEDIKPDRKVMFCDETTVENGQANHPEILKTGKGGKWAVLIGPEGGFSDREITYLRAEPNVFGVSLGPRILRADTAAVAALTLWQMTLGDWDHKDATP